MTIISIIAGFISIMSDIFWRSQLINKAQEKDRSGFLSILGMVLLVFAPITALLIQLTISRKREFVADAFGAKISVDPLSLASALTKISHDRRPMPNMMQSAAHLCFSSPLNISNIIDRMFSTHPPIEERISKLISLNEESQI
jgi:heat shock protein HtpX